MGKLRMANLPIGFVFAVIDSNAVPAGCLECDGSLISKTTYASLYTGHDLSLGNRYGESGGSFYLPDFRGRYPRGWDHGAGRDPDAASRYADSGGITGNNVGSMQNNQAGGGLHTHPSGTHTHVLATESGNFIDLTPGAIGNIVPAPGGSNRMQSESQASSPGIRYKAETAAGSGSTGLGGSGGGEGRGDNFYVMWCIKY